MNRYLASSALALVFGIAPATFAMAQQSFSDVDVSGDQQIDSSEFEAVSAEKFKAWDTDGNERLSGNELYTGLFMQWDRDSDGVLTQAEYRNGAEAWFGADAAPQFTEVDPDGDEALTRQEFAAGLGDSDVASDWNLEEDGIDWTAFHTAMFGAYDVNRDDQLSQGDYEALVIVTAVETAPDAENTAGTASGTAATDGEANMSASGNATASTSSANAIPVEEVIAIADWRIEDVYTGGISVEEVMDDAEVFGLGGDEIGDIENFVFSRDGQVLSIIAEVGGFWDLFDTHVSIPWDQVEWNGMNRVTVPVTEDNVDDYSISTSEYLTAAAAQEGVEVVEDDLTTGMNAFRATDLIGDYSRVRQDGDFVNYGYINDLIIQNGQLQSVVVTPETGYGVSGPYGYPYYRQGWNASRPYYDMPYDSAEAIEAERIDYERFRSN